MRKIILLIFILCLFINGCSLHNAFLEPQRAPVSKLIENISLGITPQQLSNHLSKTNLKIDMPNYEESPLPDEAINTVPDGRIYNITDLSFYYKIQDYDLFFTFSYEGYLVSIYCQDKKISTPKGLAVGDSLDKVKKLYGSSFEQNVDNINVLQYKSNDGYLNVFYSENMVTS